MNDHIFASQSALFDGIAPKDREAMFACTGYHVRTFQKGSVIAFEEEHIQHIGVILSGVVDMVKEDPGATRPCWCGWERMRCSERPLPVGRIPCRW